MEGAHRELLERGKAVVLKLARQIASSGEAALDIRELIAVGNMALVQAASGYDAGLGVQFTTYVYPYVRGAMLDALRREHREKRLERAIELEGRRFASIQPDEFNVLFEEPEAVRERLDVFAGSLAASMFTAMAAEARRAGTEEDLAERQSQAAAIATIHEVLKGVSEDERQIWEHYYCRGLLMREVAVELGISLITVRRRHESFVGRVRQALVSRQLVEMRTGH